MVLSTLNFIKSVRHSHGNNVFYMGLAKCVPVYSFKTIPQSFFFLLWPSSDGSFYHRFPVNRGLYAPSRETNDYDLIWPEEVLQSSCMDLWHLDETNMTFFSNLVKLTNWNIGSVKKQGIVRTSTYRRKWCYACSLATTELMASHAELAQLMVKCIAVDEITLVNSVYNMDQKLKLTIKHLGCRNVVSVHHLLD